jgi:hypothetical protein
MNISIYLEGRNLSGQFGRGILKMMGFEKDNFDYKSTFSKEIIIFCEYNEGQLLKKSQKCTFNKSTYNSFNKSTYNSFNKSTYNSFNKSTYNSFTVKSKRVFFFI